MTTSAADARTGPRYPLILLVLYLVIWAGLAIAPWYRHDWLLENMLVFIAVPLLVWGHVRIGFSKVVCTLLFIFFVLHAVGAHYTYAEVPYDRWFQDLTGRTLNQLLGLHRNHFDRLVHFAYGLLVTPAAIQLLDARAPQQGIWRWLVPFTFMAAQSAIYELIEWAAVGVFGGDLGQAYLGTQGDIWDAHKDMALGMLGAAIAVTAYRWHQADRRRRRAADSDGTRVPAN